LALIKSDLVGCTESPAWGFLFPDFELAGFRRLYSQMLFAPQLYRLCTMVSCSGIQVPCLRHLTWLMCLPSDLCTEAQSEQIRTPLFTEAQLGELDPQSAHTERGWRGLDLLNMMLVTYRY